jgi:hypothetical protein
MSSITVNVERTITFPTVIEASQEFIDVFMNVLKTQTIEKIDTINKFFTSFTEKFNANPTRFYFKTVNHSSGNTTEYNLHIYTWCASNMYNNNNTNLLQAFSNLTLMSDAPTTATSITFGLSHITFSTSSE